MNFSLYNFYLPDYSGFPGIVPTINNIEFLENIVATDTRIPCVVAEQPEFLYVDLGYHGVSYLNSTSGNIFAVSMVSALP